MANTIAKYLWLVNLLRNRGPQTFKEISDAWSNPAISLSLGKGEDLKIRTFYNHIRAIADMFDIDIECDKRGREYKYYIEQSDEEIKQSKCYWLLNNSSSYLKIMENKSLMEHIILEGTPLGAQWFDLASGAIMSCRQIEVTVSINEEWDTELAKKHGIEQERKVIVEPYFLKLYQGSWTLLGWMGEDYKYPVFIESMDYIKDLKVLDSCFTPDKKDRVLAAISNTIGSEHPGDREVDHVVIKVSECPAKEWRRRPLHPSQHEFKDNFGYTYMEYKIVVDPDFFSVIQRWGNEVEVMEPASLRSEIKINALELASVYVDKETILNHNSFPCTDEELGLMADPSFIWREDDGTFSSEK